MNYVNELSEFLQKLSFAEPHRLWWLLMVPVLIWGWRRLQHAVAHTAVRGKHKTNRFAFRVLILGSLIVASWTCLNFALAKPHFASVTYPKEYEAREFIFSLDRSGSMDSWDVEAPALAAEVDAWEQKLYKEMVDWRNKFPLLYTRAIEPPQQRPKDKNKAMIQRFAAGLYISYHVLDSRPKDSTDRYAFFTFDDRAYWLEPLGRDRLLVMEAIPEISRKGGGGTNFDGPLPPKVVDKGAVQETIDHFGKLGKAKTRVMIFVSDGDAGIDPKRHAQFVEQMTKKAGQKNGQEVHIFFLLAGPKSNFTGTTADSMKKLVKAVNPPTPEFQDAVLWVGDGAAMEKALTKINELEKSKISSDPVTEKNPVRGEFTFAGLVFLGLFMLGCSIFRENY